VITSMRGKPADRGLLQACDQRLCIILLRIRGSPTAPCHRHVDPVHVRARIVDRGGPRHRVDVAAHRVRGRDRARGHRGEVLIVRLFHLLFGQCRGIAPALAERALTRGHQDEAAGRPEADGEEDHRHQHLDRGEAAFSPPAPDLHGVSTIPLALTVTVFVKHFDGHPRTVSCRVNVGAGSVTSPPRSSNSAISPRAPEENATFDRSATVRSAVQLVQDTPTSCPRSMAYWYGAEENARSR